MKNACDRATANPRSHRWARLRSVARRRVLRSRSRRAEQAIHRRNTPNRQCQRVKRIRRKRIVARLLRTDRDRQRSARGRQQAEEQFGLWSIVDCTATALPLDFAAAARPGDQTPAATNAGTINCPAIRHKISSRPEPGMNDFALPRQAGNDLIVKISRHVFMAPGCTQQQRKQRAETATPSLPRRQASCRICPRRSVRRSPAA